MTAASAVLPKGYELHHLKSVASTNDKAADMALAGAPAGSIVMADLQTGGRGRLGRVWESPLGNLYASVILRLDCDLRESAGLSLLVGVALGEALSALGPSPLALALKWPNDILIGGAKTAGILLEGSGRRAGEAADFFVIGTGVNIRNAPAKAAYPVTCLMDEGFAPLAPVALLTAYIERLEIWLDRWRHDGFSRVREAWRDRAFGLGERVRLRLAGEEIEGLFVDLTEGGALLIEQTDGRCREVTAGDVIYPHR